MDIETYSDDDLDDFIDDELDPRLEELLDDLEPEPNLDDLLDDPPDSFKELEPYTFDDIEQRDDGVHTEVFLVYTKTEYSSRDGRDMEAFLLDSAWDNYSDAYQRSQSLSGDESSQHGIADSWVEHVGAQDASPNTFEHDSIWVVHRLTPLSGDGMSAPNLAIIVDSVHISQAEAEARVDELGPLQVTDQFKDDVMEHFNQHYGPMDDEPQMVWLKNSSIGVDADAILERADNPAGDIQVGLKGPVPADDIFIGDVPPWNEYLEAGGIDFPTMAAMTVNELTDTQHAMITVEPIRVGEGE